MKLTSAYYYPPSGRGIGRGEGAERWGVEPTEGFFVSVDTDQSSTMIRRQKGRGRMDRGDPSRGGGRSKITPKTLTEEQSDPQLAGALRSMIARLTTGDHVRVGRDRMDHAIEARHLEDVRHRREVLLRGLRETDREIEDLERAANLQSPAREP